MEPISAAMLGSAIASGVTGTGNIILEATRPRRQYRWNKKAMHDANELNKANAQWALDEQKKLQEEQRIYDSPEAQMARLKAAGLNPNMIYGGGSASAGGAFPVDFGNIAPARMDAPDAGLVLPDIAGALIRNSQGIAQANLTGAKTSESLMKQQAMAMQVEIAKTNPMLRPDVAAAVSDMMEATASMKAREAHLWQAFSPDHPESTRQQLKINAEVTQALQRLGLNTADLEIKNKILESKEFENVVKELNAKWLKDSNVTPEHIRQGLMLILGKMLH